MTRTIWCMCAVFLLALVAMPCAALDLTSGKYANTFVESEAVIIYASSSATVSLTDETGKVITTKEGNGQLDFGKLSPGYYEAISGDAKLPIVVLIDPAKRVKGDSAAAVDNAMSWLVPEEDFNNMANILRLSGMTWVRERLTWGEVAKKDGTYDFGRYIRSADALTKQGIKVYQIFHDSPAWARKDAETKAIPDDLRVAYKFGKAFATQFKGKVLAWEFWNEPDIGFFYHTSTECAALQKAIYLGAKSVDPSLRLLGPSMAGTGPFESDLLDNDAGWYMDVWNYHCYSATEDYYARADHFRKVLADHGLRLPMWTTEAGDPFAEGLDGILSGSALKHQARFISRAFTQGTANGVERFYYFVFPFYHEGARGWGVFGPGNKYPYPGLAAMSTVTYALGQAKYKGTIDTGKTPQRLLVFNRGDGTVCVAAWQNSEISSEMTLPFSWSVVKDARDYLGRVIPSSDGKVKLELADGASYFIINSKDLHVKYAKPTPAPKLAKAVKPGLTQIVPRLVYTMPVSYVGGVKTKDAYLVDPRSQVDINAQVYNFGTKPIEGEIIFRGDKNCQVTPKSVKCSVAPGGVFNTPVTVKAKGMPEIFTLSMVVRSKGLSSSRASVRFGLDPFLIPRLEGMKLDYSKPEQWRTNITGGGKITIDQDPDGGVRFASVFPPNVDRWTYPETVPGAKIDLTGYNAIQFEYKTGPNDKGDVRAMLVEDGAIWYISGGLPVSDKWKQATVLFREMWPFQPADKKLDLNKIVQLRVGANSQTDNFTISVRDIRAVKM